MKKNFQMLLLLLGCISPFNARPMDITITHNNSIVYVWDFNVSHDSLRARAADLTEDFETELIRSGLYTVLERRKYNRVLAHQSMEVRISGIQNLSTASKDSLKAIRADIVIFGELKYDFQSGVYEVTVTFQRLDEVILKKESVLIERPLIDHNQTRKKSMRELLGKVHSWEAMAAKKIQYDKVSKLLANYMLRVKDVQKEFRDVVEFAFDNDNYFEELIRIVEDYNEVFIDLNNNGAEYHMNFIKQWNEPRGRELKDIFNGIENDIHRSYILKLDRVRKDIISYRSGNMSNSQKKAKKDRIVRSLMETTADLKTQIEIMDLKINTFLSHLMVELSG